MNVENGYKLPALWRVVLCTLITAISGARTRPWFYRFLLKYEIDPTANLGLTFIRVANLKMGPGSSIGNFTIIRNLERVELAENSSIGTFNWIFGMLRSSRNKHFQLDVDRKPFLIMERDSCITSRHILDCTDQVLVGPFATVAGFRSQILTHGIDIAENRQSAAPVEIGKYCLIGSGVLILKGSKIPDYSILAAGSVFRGAPKNTHTIYSGVPATAVKSISEDLPYFSREIGGVN